MPIAAHASHTAATTSTPNLGPACQADDCDGRLHVYSTRKDETRDVIHGRLRRVPYREQLGRCLTCGEDHVRFTEDQDAILWGPWMLDHADVPGHDPTRCDVCIDNGAGGTWARRAE